MVLRIVVVGDPEDEERVHAILPRVLGLGFAPVGQVTDRLAGGWMARTTEACAAHRYDEHHLPLPDLCGLDRYHLGDCGNWQTDTTRCPGCKRTESDHLRDLMRDDVRCTAWPPPVGEPMTRLPARAS